MDGPLIIPITVTGKPRKGFMSLLSLTEHSERMMGIGESGDDRISQLPENVIHHILMLLPIKDAARTAFMSTIWRRHWRSIPRLVFDDGFARITEPSMMDKLILKIYKSLLVHDGPISKFVLAVPGLTPCDELDHIIFHLSGRGVQEFTLVLSSGVGHIYKLPSSLFTTRLNCLKLEGCLFMVPPWFVGFGKLTELELFRVNLPSDFFGSFLPKCPLLRDLRLFLCEGPTNLELDAPRLVVFFFARVLLQKLFFKRTPLLSVLSLYVDVFQKPNVVDLFASLPALRHLHILPAFLRVLANGGHIPSRFPKPLYRLQLLRVSGLLLASLEMQRVLACIIMSSPNLHTLMIQLDTIVLNEPRNNDAVTSIRSLLSAEDSHGSDFSLQHLKVFKINDSLGTQVEMELVRLILATAPLLLRIQIQPYHLLSSKKVTKFMKEVMQYKRISKEAEIIYVWNDEED
ncbi:unnamed protein product [Linum trigynum]|uniref:F-box domain-containing protein n=1 Tax=Linum trigynum TaxID=586398 RepID=A0AAV2GF03_9ROSI